MGLAEVRDVVGGFLHIGWSLFHSLLESFQVIAELSKKLYLVILKHILHGLRTFRLSAGVGLHTDGELYGCCM